MSTKKATLFEFTSYAFEPQQQRILFTYKTSFENAEPLFFTETILLPKVPDIDAIPKELIAKVLESVHIILGISYYKSYCATNIQIPYSLSKIEADFWYTVYKKGLGEFFYQNKLDPKILPTFLVDTSAAPTPFSLQKNNKCLVGIGGGKDSIVTAELLKEAGVDIEAFVVQTHQNNQLIDKVIDLMGIKKLVIQRVLDEKIYTEHLYNGHIPISAIYAFLGLLSAVLYQYSYVVVSNEHSSNFGNLTYKGLVINHQWSKSIEFETLFADYIKNIITPDVTYFSLLRSFYEIRIVGLFSRYKKYFPYFSSCNRNFSRAKTHQGLWCGECPKCVFVFTLLSAFLTKKELLDIFKKNLYEDKNLLPLFADVLGFGKMKPFDCVGTFDEAQIAVSMASKKFKQSLIVNTFLPKIKIGKKDIQTIFTTYPSKVPTQFQFLGMENALILGYGKEGKITKQYLKKYYPTLKVGIADAAEDVQYLNTQKLFDVAIKTPGIPKEVVTIPYTTATNIFFSKVLGKNTIIGVTGSKGKSTTASLIFSIIKESGKKVRLLGNIGTPMVEALLHPIDKDEVFVVELSSAQLDDIHYSPDIAVVTSLFPEHLDYHKGYKNYLTAKKHIIDFHSPDNYFVYDAKNVVMQKWLKDYKGKAIPFADSIPVQESEIPLLGEHNKNNIKAAIQVATILGIDQEVIKSAVRKFKPLPHRLELVGTFKGITFYNDANAATPEAAIMAIKTLKNVDTIFLGGQDRGYDFRQLEKTIKQYKIKNVVLFPDTGKKIIPSKKGFTILETKSMKEAVAFAYQYTEAGSICLLSCGSPSYSLWKNFEEKGDQFKKFVNALDK